MIETTAYKALDGKIFYDKEECIEYESALKSKRSTEYLFENCVELLEGKIRMSMSEWAKREVEIACKRERGGKPDNEWNYGCACYESALKAYNSLMEDGHSGYSMGVTSQILIRLLNGKTLTPIEDTDDVWNDITIKLNDSKRYQCKRMSSLFKYVYKDETVRYSDVTRIICYDLNSNPKIGFHTKTVLNVIDEMFPIEMPYFPNNEPIKVYLREYLTNENGGDFDTVEIICAVFPNAKKEKIDRYFKETEEGWKEIDSAELSKRRNMHFKRKNAEQIEKDGNKNE